MLFVSASLINLLLFGRESAFSVLLRTLLKE